MTRQPLRALLTATLLVGLLVTTTLEPEAAAVQASSLAMAGASSQDVVIDPRPPTDTLDPSAGTADFALPETAFADVSPRTQFFAEISWLHTTGIATGWENPDGSREYRPLNYVARDAMAAFLYRLSGSPTYTPPPVSSFIDVSPRDAFYKEISWLHETGITTGWDGSDGSREFRPLAPINRNAMAAFLFRLSRQPVAHASNPPPFTDVVITDPFYDEITWAAATGITTGWPGQDGTAAFRPLQPIARDAMAAFLYRYHLIESEAESAGFDLIENNVVPHTAYVTVALIAPPGTTPRFTREDVSLSVSRAVEFLETETEGSLTVEVELISDWMYPTETWPCSWSGAWQDWAANQLGWDGGPSRHLSVIVPEGDPCPGWANGVQGWWLGAGGATFQPGIDPTTLTHEWGHNFSQAHAFSTACPSWDFVAVDGSTPTECSRREYGNHYDVLGASWSFTPFSSPSLARIGMLPHQLQPRCGISSDTVDSAAAGAGGRDPITWESTREPGVRYWIDYRDQAQGAKYAHLHNQGWHFGAGASGLQIMRTDPEVPFGATALQRPGDESDRAQLVQAGEQIELSDGTSISWAPVEGSSSQAEVTITREC